MKSVYLVTAATALVSYLGCFALISAATLRTAGPWSEPVDSSAEIALASVKTWLSNCANAVGAHPSGCPQLASDPADPTSDDYSWHVGGVPLFAVTSSIWSANSGQYLIAGRLNMYFNHHRRVPGSSGIDFTAGYGTDLIVGARIAFDHREFGVYAWPAVPVRSLDYELFPYSVGPDRPCCAPSERSRPTSTG